MAQLGNWADKPCYYVDVVDGKRVAMLLGPFRKHGDALNMVDAARDYTVTQYPMAHFYAFGTCKRENGHIDSKFNSHFMANGTWDGTCDCLSEC